MCGKVLDCVLFYSVWEFYKFYFKLMVDNQKGSEQPWKVITLS